MMVLITYDVDTTSITGKRRLRKVAKECVNYGRRVQNSVFECLLTEAPTRPDPCPTRLPDQTRPDPT